MIITFDKERSHFGDYNYFIHDKDEDIYKVRSIRNCCLDFISNLIDLWREEAVEKLL